MLGNDASLSQLRWQPKSLHLQLMLCYGCIIMTNDSPELLLRDKIQQFVRAFGLLQDQTPCGHALSISAAHAVMVLTRYGSNGPSCSQSDLQRELNLNKSSVTRLCASLESQGFVVQTVSEDDRRVRQISLTKKGERLAFSLLNASQDRFAKLWQRIPKKQQSEVLRSLEALTAALSQIDRDT